jgi:hypothetical protein
VFGLSIAITQQQKNQQNKQTNKNSLPYSSNILKMEIAGAT